MFKETYLPNIDLHIPLWFQTCSSFHGSPHSRMAGIPGYFDQSTNVLYIPCMDQYPEGTGKVLARKDLGEKVKHAIDKEYRKILTIYVNLFKFTPKEKIN